jgi:hypothetical protein
MFLNRQLYLIDSNSAFYTYKNSLANCEGKLLTKPKVDSNSKTSGDREFFVCSECKARCRSGDLLNEHIYEEHGKQ